MGLANRRASIEREPAAHHAGEAWPRMGLYASYAAPEEAAGDALRQDPDHDDGRDQQRDFAEHRRGLESGDLVDEAEQHRSQPGPGDDHAPPPRTVMKALASRPIPSPARHRKSAPARRRQGRSARRRAEGGHVDARRRHAKGGGHSGFCIVARTIRPKRVKRSPIQTPATASRAMTMITTP